jgi:type VI protein secretion system component VasF
MSGLRKEQHDQPAQESRRAPFDFAQANLIYASRRRRHRNRWYGIMAALVIVAVGLGMVAMLLADWLSNFVK